MMLFYGLVVLDILLFSAIFSLNYYFYRPVMRRQHTDIKMNVVDYALDHHVRFY